MADGGIVSTHLGGPCRYRPSGILFCFSIIDHVFAGLDVARHLLEFLVGPISSAVGELATASVLDRIAATRPQEVGVHRGGGSTLPAVGRTRDMAVRSEERRVGKECRSRWWPDH